MSNETQPPNDSDSGSSFGHVSHGYLLVSCTSESYGRLDGNQSLGKLHHSLLHHLANLQPL